MSFGEIVFSAVLAGAVGLWLYGITITDGDTIRRILWDDTVLGWGWKKLFGERKKAKQAPMIFTSAPPPAGRIANAGTYGRLTAMKAAPKGFSTSSLNIPPPMSHIGKPLTIKNWDRITGFKVDVLGRSWFVVNAIHTGSGYECILESRSTHHTITFCIYDIMYDSHQVTVFCKGRVARLDVGACKDPQLLLDKVAYEFADKFDV